jgi:hypothetical protein
LIDLQSGGQAGEERDESFPMGFSRREVAEHCSGLYLMHEAKRGRSCVSGRYRSDHSSEAARAFFAVVKSSRMIT